MLKMANKKEPHYQAHRMHSRSRASSVLWGHLLSRDASTPSLTPRVQSDVTSLSPITPLDKAGTSMRILLHDTQAHLEKFSDRVTKLINGVDESKREIVTVQKLFEQDREKLVEETVDLGEYHGAYMQIWYFSLVLCLLIVSYILNFYPSVIMMLNLPVMLAVNRCQTEIQRTVGAPAQASKIDELQADLVAVDSKLHALDKKMDLLHMVRRFVCFGFYGYVKLTWLHSAQPDTNTGFADSSRSTRQDAHSSHSDSSFIAGCSTPY